MFDGTFATAVDKNCAVTKGYIYHVAGGWGPGSRYWTTGFKKDPIGIGKEMVAMKKIDKRMEDDIEVVNGIIMRKAGAFARARFGDDVVVRCELEDVEALETWKGGKR
jgi:hypothetical protein